MSLHPLQPAAQLDLLALLDLMPASLDVELSPPPEATLTIAETPPITADEGEPLVVPALAPRRLKRLSVFVLPEGSPPTFEELMRWVGTRPDLSESSQRDLRSALRRGAQILHLPPANVLADVAKLNHDLYRHPPAAHGLGHEAFEQLVSRLRRVLRLAGWHAPETKGEARLSPVWKSFLGQVAPTGLRAGLRGLARFCEQHGLGPQDMNDALLARFMTEDATMRIFPEAHGRGSQLAHSWNRALSQQPEREGLPELRAPRHRIPYTVPLSELPETFQADVEAFAARFMPMAAKPQRGAGAGSGPGAGPWTRVSPLEAGRSRRRFRPWRPATRDTRLFSIRQAAAAVLATGIPREALISLEVLVQPLENAERILQFYLDRADGKIGSQRESISKVLTLIARHHVAVPPDDLDTLVNWHREFTPPNQLEMGPKVRECLRQLWQEDRRAILLALPAHLMERAREDNLQAHERARLQRMACIIEQLICCPMRIGNLHKLTFDKHLRYLDGPRRPSHIQLEGRETKNGQEQTFSIPKAAGDLLQTYINKGRKVLAAPGNPYLFPGQNGEGPLSTDQVRASFQATVAGATGVEVHPHAMRGFACLLFLDRFPGQYELLRRILGHADVETTRRYYTGLETMVAFEMADEALLSQRRDGRLRGEAALERLRAKPRSRRGR